MTHPNAKIAGVENATVGMGKKIIAYFWGFSFMVKYVCSMGNREVDLLTNCVKKHSLAKKYKDMIFF